MSKVRSEVKERHLECDLTEEELLEYGRDNANQIQQRSSLEYERKAYNSRIKSDIDAAGEIIEKLSLKISTRKEFRDVECRTIEDYDEFTIKVIRLDTNEVITDRAMTKAEKAEVDNLFLKEETQENVEAETEGEQSADPELTCSKCGHSFTVGELIKVNGTVNPDDLPAWSMGRETAAVRLESASDYDNMCLLCAEDYLDSLTESE